MNWEKITVGEYRAKVFGGWIVQVYGPSSWSPIPMSICFVPDVNHEWKIR